MTGRKTENCAKQQGKREGDNISWDAGVQIKMWQQEKNFSILIRKKFPRAGNKD
jgi:hypothetical protein